MNRLITLAAPGLTVVTLGCNSQESPAPPEAFIRPHDEVFEQLDEEQNGGSNNYNFGIGFGLSFACNPELLYDEDGEYSQDFYDRLEAVIEGRNAEEVQDILEGIERSIERVEQAESLGELCLVS